MDIYIITGITGYVGSVLAKTLISKGYKVRGLARSKNKLLKVFSQNELEHLDIVYGDIVSKEDIENLLNCEGKKYVIHTAASVSIESKKLTKGLYNINVNGTINICEACIKNHVEKFIYVSSTNALVTSVKGKINEPSIYEANKINGGYGKSKALASQYVLDKINNKELNGVIIHPSAIIGPGDYSNTHMSQLMSDFLNHKLPCSIKGNYNFVDVRDVVNLILIMLKNDTKRANYIIASQSETVTNFINIIAKYKNLKKIKNVLTFLAYIGLPFVRLYCLIKHIRPLYTLYALQTVKENADFDNSIVKNEFNYSFKSLEESVIDQVEFIINKKS